MELLIPRLRWDTSVWPTHRGRRPTILVGSSSHPLTSDVSPVSPELLLIVTTSHPVSSVWWAAGHLGEGVAPHELNRAVCLDRWHAPGGTVNVSLALPTESKLLLGGLLDTNG